MVQTGYGWSVGYIGGQIKMGRNEMVGGVWSQMTKEVLCQSKLFGFCLIGNIFLKKRAIDMITFILKQDIGCQSKE